METAVDSSWVITDSSSYDYFLGCFVDAVQAPDSEFCALCREWWERCPFPWKQQFEADLRDIEALVAGGDFCASGSCEDAALPAD